MQKFLPGKYGSKINVLMVAMNSFTGGLCGAWPSAIFPKILKEGHVVHLNLDEISLSVVFMYVGQLAALVPFSIVENALGKAKTLKFGILFAILGWIVIILFANNIGIYCAMVLFGFWLSISGLSNGPYLAEISSPKNRGTVLALMSIFNMIGAIVEISLSIFLTYKGLAFVNFTVTIVQLLLLFLLPETPYFYLRRFDVSKALMRFLWFRGESEAGKKEFEDAVLFNEAHMKFPKFLDICKDFSTRQALFFSLTVTFFQKISANIPLQAYSGILLNSYIEPRIFPLFFFSVSAIFNTLSAIFIDKVGRRKLLVISSSGTFVLSVCSAVWFCLLERTKIDVRFYNFIPYITLTLETAFFSLGLQYIPGVINGEIFAAHIKSKSLSIIAFAQISLNLINSRLFMVFVQHRLTFVNFSVYSIVSLISVFYLIKVYDTKGKTLEEIYDHFDRRGRRRSTLEDFPRPPPEIQVSHEPQIASIASTTEINREKTPERMRSPSPDSEKPNYVQMKQKFKILTRKKQNTSV